MGSSLLFDLLWIFDVHLRDIEVRGRLLLELCSRATSSSVSYVRVTKECSTYVVRGRDWTLWSTRSTHYVGITLLCVPFTRVELFIDTIFI
jgi:hypothetical protein